MKQSDNWMFEWKCRRCGETFAGRTYVPDGTHIQDVLMDAVTNRANARIRIPREHTHVCQDGGSGIGELIGAKREEIPTLSKVGTDG
jgi:hypothetical protein